MQGFAHGIQEEQHGKNGQKPDMAADFANQP